MSQAKELTGVYFHKNKASGATLCPWEHHDRPSQYQCDEKELGKLQEKWTWPGAQFKEQAVNDWQTNELDPEIPLLEREWEQQRLDPEIPRLERESGGSGGQQCGPVLEMDPDQHREMHVAMCDRMLKLERRVEERDVHVVMLEQRMEQMQASLIGIANHLKLPEVAETFAAGAPGLELPVEGFAASRIPHPDHQILAAGGIPQHSAQEEDRSCKPADPMTRADPWHESWPQPAWASQSWQSQSEATWQ